jgi:hypothetical protein
MLMVDGGSSNTAGLHGFFLTFPVSFLQITPRARRLSLDDVGKPVRTNYANVSCVNKSYPALYPEPQLMVQRRHAPCYSLARFLRGLTLFDAPSASVTVQGIACSS